MTSRPIEILLVEDNPGDVRLTLEAFKEGEVLNNFTVMNDGVEALAYLRRQGRYANSAQPDLILLDLNLPRKDGREVLAEIKAELSISLPQPRNIEVKKSPEFLAYRNTIWDLLRAEVLKAREQEGG